ncbi:MAG: zinc-binding alcohol dehydrogenase [Hyphomicrobiales bacterium]
MPDQRTIRSLGVERPGRMFFFSYEEHPLEEGQFRVETLFTGFSAGTELTFVKGSNPYLSAKWDDRCKIFTKGEASARYPIPFLGYMEVGRVIGTHTSAVREGDIVGMAYGHKSGHTADAAREFFLPLPSDLDPLLGIYVAQMGPICANGLLHAAADLVGTDVRDLGEGVRGRNLIVMGAGVVGLLSALFCRKCGAAEVLVADPSSYRRSKAAAMGFTTVPETDLYASAKERWSHGEGDRGADLVLQCRASAASLHESLRALRPQGTVIDLAFYQGGADSLRLGEEFHHNGLAIRCAQIGRVPRGLSFAWNRQRLARETVGLVQATGDLIREHMISDILPFEDAPAFLANLVEHRRDFVQIVFEVAQ